MKNIPLTKTIQVMQRIVEFSKINGAFDCFDADETQAMVSALGYLKKFKEIVSEEA